MFVAAASLCDLAREDVWPVVRWQTALSTWRAEKRVSLFLASDRPLGRNHASDQACRTHTRPKPAKRWRCSGSARAGVYRSVPTHPRTTPYQANRQYGRFVQYRSSNQAYNPSPAQLVRPNDNDGLPSDVGLLLTQVCDTGSAPCRAGRGILALHLITLFRLDPVWTRAHPPASLQLVNP